MTFRSRYLLIAALLLLGTGLAASGALAGGRGSVAAVSTAGSVVGLETSHGTIHILLDRKRAPISVANFIAYVKAGQYNGTVFHRVIDNFMIQGGGFTTAKAKKSVRPPIKNEADNGLRNLRGTIAMARTSDPHSATAQFFINVKTNTFLNHKAKTAAGWGYCVFGKVSKGMPVVDIIKGMPTTNQGGAFRNAPVTPVVIKRAWVVK